MKRMLSTALVSLLSVAGFVGVAHVAAAAAPSVPIAAQAQAKVDSKTDRPRKPVYERVNGKLREVPKSKLVACSGPCYNYMWASRDVTATSNSGVTDAANLVSVHKPAREGQYHTLHELAVEDIYSAGGRNVVEIGWTVDLSLNGDENPHLFTYAWANGSGLGYNATFAEYVDNPGEVVNAGTSLAYTAAGAAPTSYYQHRIIRCNRPAWAPSGGGVSAAGWCVMRKPQAAADTTIGYYPDSVWTSRGTSFTQAPRVDSFGEIASVSTEAEACTDGGSGVFGSSTTPSAAGDHLAFSLAGYPGVTNTFTLVQVDGAANSGAGGSPTAWRIWNSYVPADPDRYRWGGPGYNSAGTGTGSIGAC